MLDSDAGCKAVGPTHLSLSRVTSCPQFTVLFQVVYAYYTEKLLPLMFLDIIKFPKLSLYLYEIS